MALACHFIADPGTSPTPRLCLFLGATRTTSRHLLILATLLMLHPAKDSTWLSHERTAAHRWFSAQYFRPPCSSNSTVELGDCTTHTRTFPFLFCVSFESMYAPAVAATSAAWHETIVEEARVGGFDTPLHRTPLCGPGQKRISHGHLPRIPTTAAQRHGAFCSSRSSYNVSPNTQQIFGAPFSTRC